MSIFGKQKHFLLTKNFMSMLKIYRHKLNDIFYVETINFFIFFAEKYLGTFSVDNI